jgi:two-component system, response regulator PdtaR
MAFPQKKQQTEILIVEDDEIISSLIERFLLNRGYYVCGKVKSGEDALYKTAEFLPRIVLMDINLTGKMDGITATKFITSIFHIPVIFLSGVDDDTTMQRAVLAESSGFILKPFSEKTLFINIEIVIHNDQILKQSKNYQHGKTGRIARAALSELDAYFILDIRGRILFINPYAEQLLHVSRADTIFKHINKYLTFFDTRQNIMFTDTFIDVIRESLVLGIKQHIAVKMSDNSFRYVVIQSTSIRDYADEPLGMIIRMHIKTKSEV